MNIEKQKILLSVEDLSLSFRMYDKGFIQRDVVVLDRMNIQVKQGEILAVIGASGSGKSLLAHAILGILPKNASIAGDIRLFGEPLSVELCQKARGKDMALVPQSVNYFDPLMRVGKQVRGHDVSKEDQRKVFKRYGLSESDEEFYPFQLSGGMARRALVSTAVVRGPKLIIADEPTPGLTLEQSREVMKNFRELANEGCGILLITHDIDVALTQVDRICIFYGGRSLETIDAESFRQGGKSLKHPYTRDLWAAMPQNGFKPPKEGLEELASYKEVEV